MSRRPISMRFLLLLLIALATSSDGICASPSDADQRVKAEGIIDRVIVAGSEPVFRAAGYTVRITAALDAPATEVHFGKGMQTLSDVETNTFVTFEETLDSSGSIVATKAAFARLKLPKSKPNANAVQVTTFPPGSRIDGYNGFATASSKFRMEDHGGWCGWYEVPGNAIEQERIRRLGVKLVPQYQRDLPADDPAKIPFRFYVVDEKEIRSDIFCGKGLVLVPLEVVNRLKTEDQLAAVLADGIAGELQQQAADSRIFTVKDAAELAALGALGFGPIPAAIGGTGGLIMLHKVNRAAEHERGRMAQAFTTDAGFDSHQAPEAWRLLAPYHLPKDHAKLKDPERSLYLQNILEVQYKAVLGDTAPEAAHATAVPPGS